MARNPRLQAAITTELAQAETLWRQHQQPARLFKDFASTTLNSWSRPRRVVAKAEVLPRGPNPRFVVTLLSAEQIQAQPLYQQLYCARDERENRIQEQQGDLFADRTSAHTRRANQLRLWLTAFAYVWVEGLRRPGLTHTAVLTKARFWERVVGFSLNRRQHLVLNHLLDDFEGKLTTSKWAKLTQCSQDTALRNITDLIEHDILIRNPEGGRSTSHDLVKTS